MREYTRPAGSLISYMSNKVKAHGGINLAQGLPGFPPPTELTDILASIARENVHQYAPGSGDAQLLEETAKLFGSSGITPESVLITNGATEAISLTYTYLSRTLPKPFSTLAFEPVYESYRHLPGIFGNRFVPFDLSGGFFARREAFRETVRENAVKIVFLSSPGNPWGRIWDRDEVVSLVDLSEELDFSIVLDGVYRDIYFDAAPYLPFDRIGPRLFFADSFSKMLSITGWRVGYLVADKRHLAAIRTIHDYTGLSSPSVLQRAVARYLAENRSGELYLAELRTRIKLSFNEAYAELRDLGFEMPRIDGGYFLWAKLPEGFFDGFLFAEDLYDREKVAVVPGIHFSAEADRFVRVNIARPMAEIKDAARRIAAYVTVNR